MFFIQIDANCSMIGKSSEILLILRTKKINIVNYCHNVLKCFWKIGLQKTFDVYSYTINERNKYSKQPSQRYNLQSLTQIKTNWRFPVNISFWAHTIMTPIPHSYAIRTVSNALTINIYRYYLIPWIINYAEWNATMKNSSWKILGICIWI
jgi:hypothetical protein